MLVLADRGFCGFPLWSRATATGADLLWRAMASMKPRHVETLVDGTWLAELRPSGNAARHATPLVIRVIDYTIDDGRTNDGTYRLFTTLVDPDEAPAEELALAYAQRWEIEGALDELKTHQRGARTVLRSKAPDLVLQEIWGHLCCHYAIRTLMWEAAEHAGVDPDRVSFVAALRIARRSIAAARDFPPSGD
jgi:IS4 transposase